MIKRPDHLYSSSLQRIRGDRLSKYQGEASHVNLGGESTLPDHLYPQIE